MTDNLPMYDAATMSVGVGGPTQPVSVESMMVVALRENKVEALERLVALKERQDARSEERAFNLAMIAAQQDIEPVAKDRQNTDNRSWYATFESVHSAVVPIVAKHGFALSFGTADSPIAAHIRIVCDCMHRDGHSRRYQCDLGIDDKGMKGGATKTMVQGEGSTMSYGRRYLTLMIFNVALTKEDNDGRQKAETISAEQAQELRDLLAAAGRTERALCEVYAVPSLNMLPANLHSAARNSVARAARAKQTQQEPTPASRPTLRDALTAIRAGDHALAMDIARHLAPDEAAAVAAEVAT